MRDSGSMYKQMNMKHQFNPENPEEDSSNNYSGSKQSASEFSHQRFNVEKRTYVIAVANQKGGVAKTTTVVSLGGALVEYDMEVLLIDLDSQANLTLALGKDPNRVRGAITEVLFNSATLLSVSRETSIPGLDLVPSNSGMDIAERFLPVRKDYEHILRRALKESLKRPLTNYAVSTGINEDGNPAFKPSHLSKQSESDSNRWQGSEYRERVNPSLNYDFVIIDCPPFMGAVTLNALVAADMLLIPTQPEFFSAHALKTMMSTIKQVRGQFNADLTYRILITMFDQRNRIHRDVKNHIKSTFGDGVFQTNIGIDTKLRESAVEGVPISHHKKSSRSALQYDALAQELIAYVR